MDIKNNVIQFPLIAEVQLEDLASLEAESIINDGKGRLDGYILINIASPSAKVNGDASEVLLSSGDIDLAEAIGLLELAKDNLLERQRMSILMDEF